VAQVDLCGTGYKIFAKNSIIRLWKKIPTITWTRYYKTFYVRILRIFVIS
jgi:hypothetical protein